MKGSKVLKELSRFPRVLLHDGVLYVGTANSIHAVSVKDGKPLWSQSSKMGAYRTFVSMTVHKNLVWNFNTGGEPYRPGRG